MMRTLFRLVALVGVFTFALPARATSPLAAGDNGSGGLGNGGQGGIVSTPANCTTTASFAQIAAGVGHNVARRTDGGVFTWGYNAYGQLGNANTGTNGLNAVQIAGGALSGRTAISVAAGETGSFAVLDNGTVASWGRNDTGRLGTGNTTDRSTPGLVVGADGGGTLGNIATVESGSSITAAVDKSGRVWVWGTNTGGALGNGNTTNRFTPDVVPGIYDAISVAVGDDFCLALLSDGTVKAWGLNSSGQLGDGTTTNRLTPIVIPGLTRVVQIAAGKTHAAAIRDDNTLWTWGSNGNGQLGIGNTTNQSSPQQVNTTNVAEVSCGGSFTAFRRADGGVRAMGQNASGQLGTGSTTQATSPAIVSGVSNCVGLGAGRDHTIYLISFGGSTPAPMATTGGAAGLSPTSVRMRGVVNPNGLSNAAHFDYGTSSSYGSSTSNVTVSGASIQFFRGDANGLTEGTTYHYRLVTTSVGGTSNGADATFVAGPGLLDQSFSEDGKTTASASTSNSGFNIQLNKTVLQSDGKFVAVGSSSMGLLIERFNADGTLDTTFNGTGAKTVTVTGFDAGTDVVVQSNGKMVVADSTGSANSVAVVRLNADGSLDTTLNGTGKASTQVDSSAGYTTTTAVTVAPDGTIVVVGALTYGYYSYNGSYSTFTSQSSRPAIVCYNADGSVKFQSTFGPVYYGTYSGANAVAVQSDGKIIVSGYSDSSLTVWRLAVNGGMDTSFGSGGISFPGVGRAASVVVQPDGKIVLGGTATSGGNAVTRLTASGAIDSSFGGGQVITPVGISDFGQSVALQGDGKILIAGYSYPAGSSFSVFELVRYHANGTLDTSFNGTGKVTTAYLGSNGGLVAYSCAVRGDGTIALAGTTSYNEFAATRYLGKSAGPDIAVQQPVNTFLTSGGNTVNCGSANLGVATTALTFTIGNYGLSDLTNLAVSIDGAAAGDFATGTIGSTTLAPGATTTITVTFTPRGSGARTAALHIASNDPDESPFDIALTGTGIGTLAATYTTGQETPLTANGFTATGSTVTATLNYAPTTGTNLTLVNNTGLSFINGQFTNLAQGQVVTLSYGGVAYKFVANYYGGTGNDLVLQWANVRPVAWGYNGRGQLGNNSTTNGLVPGAVTASGVLAGKTVVAVAAGVYHSLALCSDGTLAAWGDNGYGQLGNNSTTRSSVPVLVQTSSGVLTGKTVIAVATGAYYSVALCSDGTLAAWGYNYFGQLGNNSTTDSSVPVLVQTSSGVLAGKTVVAVAAGVYHSVALCSDGTLAAWGYNYFGQLGNNSTTDSSVPVLVQTSSGVLAGKTVVAVAAGGEHSMTLCADGTLAAWGDNGYGQLGNNSTTSSSVPVLVQTSSGVLAGKTVVAVCAGYVHSVALCADGTLAAWGYNYDGELGNNSTTNSSVPVLVQTSSGVLAGKTVVAVAAGGEHSMALCTDGTLAAWGYNVYGELGNNSTTSSSSVPVLVSSSALAAGERWARVSSGSFAYHNLALIASPPDNTPPVLGAVAIASNSAHSAWAKLGDTVTLSFTASEAIQTPSVTLLGVTVTATNSSGNTWTATAPVSSATAEGPVAFSITATDLAGNTAAAVTMTTNGSSVKVDRTSPVLNLPANIVTTTVNAAAKTVSFSAGASDALDPAPVVTVTPASGSSFAVGTTTVNVAATDAAGNAASGSFTVTVYDDTIYPSFTANPNPVSYGAAVSFDGTATRQGDPRRSIASWSWDFGDGTGTGTGSTTTHVFIHAGLYGVTLTAADDLGRTATSTRLVTVTDAVPPVLSLPPNLVVEATSAAGALVTYTASANDAGSGIASSSFAPASGTTFPLGITTVNASAKDGSGNTVAGTFTVTVRDTTAPSVTAPASFTVHATNPAGATVTFTPTASDGVGVTSIEASPASGTPFPNGTTTVTVTAKDAANNTGTAQFTVTVTPLSTAESWRYANFGRADNSGNAADNADPDGDGVVNLLEFAFGTDPNNAASGRAALEYHGTFGGGGAAAAHGSPQALSEATTNGVDFRALFMRRTDFAAVGLTYTVEFSATLATWAASTATPALLAEDGAYQVVSVPYPFFVGGKKARFFRVLVSTGP